MQTVTDIRDLPDQRLMEFALDALDLRIDDYKMQPVQIAWRQEKGGLEYSQYLCHNYFVVDQMPREGTSLKARPIRSVFNVATTQCRPSANEYLDYLYSYDSPYEELLRSDKVYILREPAGLKRIIGVYFDNYTEAGDVRLANNFLIATRLQCGWSLDHFWKLLTDAGMHPAIALRTLALVSVAGQTLTYSSTRTSQHVDLHRKMGIYLSGTSDQPFNNASFASAFIYPTRARSLVAKKYRTDVPAYRCNSIWSIEGEYHTTNDTSVLQKAVDVYNTKGQKFSKGLISELSAYILEQW